VTDPPATRAAQRLEAAAPRRPGTFAALHHRNFRLFFVGQMISLIGTWMQRIAQAWLVLQITDSPFLLGFVGMLQWLPVLMFSLIGGVLADRVRRTRVLGATIVLWGAAMLWSATASSFGELLVTRLFLGAVTASAGPMVASLVGPVWRR